ncbi:MAG: hypothetical protein IJD81_05215 [Oscillospiraceae bacterium]|nr:hypothetical protein [Oscillospiraceae bacterium]
MKEVKMLFSLILRVLVVVIGWLAWGYLIYGFGSGALPLWDRGLAADTEGNVYVGSAVYIQVYSPTGEHLREISAQTDRGYQFTILNDELHINLSDSIIVLDTRGIVLRKEDPDPLSWHLLSKDRFTAEDGTQYKLGRDGGRKAIMVKTAEEWTPLVRYPTEPYTKLLTCFALIGLAALSLWSIIDQFKKDKF